MGRGSQTREQKATEILYGNLGGRAAADTPDLSRTEEVSGKESRLLGIDVGREYKATNYYDADGRLYLIEVTEGTLRYETAESTESFWFQKGTRVYLDDQGRPHREGAPAVLESEGQETWYKHGRRHRDDGPAEIIVMGSTTITTWYHEGRRHRDNGPAIITVEEVPEYGHKEEKYEWCQNGRRHRDDGPAVITKAQTLTELGSVEETTETWYQKDKKHRKGGPAHSDSWGIREYYHNGHLHCLTGPAKYRDKVELDAAAEEHSILVDFEPEYWIGGVQLGFEEWSRHPQTS